MEHRVASAIVRTAALAVLALPSAALAAEEDTQLWGFFEVSAPLGDDLSASVETSPRFTESGDTLESRVLVEYEVVDGVELGGGLLHGARPGGNEIRPFQQVELKMGPVASRTRLEQRFFDGADRTQWRLRQRLGVSQPVVEKTDLVGQVELLYILQDDERGVGSSVDNWRFTVGAEHEVSDRLMLGLGYMLMWDPNGSAEDEISHVPQVTVEYSL